MLQKFDVMDGTIFVSADWGQASSPIRATHQLRRKWNDIVNVELKTTQWQVGDVGHCVEKFLQMYIVDDCCGGCFYDDDDGHDRIACAADRAAEIAETEETVVEQVDVYEVRGRASAAAKLDAADCWEIAAIDDRTEMETGHDHNYDADIKPPTDIDVDLLRDEWADEYRYEFANSWNAIYSDAPDDEKSMP